VDVKSDIYAVVSEIHVSPGAEVAVDDILMTLESMKMEIPVTAPAAGRVRSIAVTEGSDVQEDDLLLVLDPG
jgi:acetyl-CoA carboxylase biotin carboxyl carrier protein